MVMNGDEYEGDEEEEHSDNDSNEVDNEDEDAPTEKTHKQRIAIPRTQKQWSLNEVG